MTTPRVREARAEEREAALQFMKWGEQRSDPRAIGLANFTLSLTELGYEAPEAALARADPGPRSAVSENPERVSSGRYVR